MNILNKLWENLEEVCSFDLRSIGAFRIFLGAIFIGDLIKRSFDLKAHYSDYGIMSRETLFDCCHRLFHISINMISGEVWVQGVIFFLAGICGFLLMIGYRSRLMAVLCFFFAVSIQMRNPIILNSGDNLYRLMLFLGSLLPLSARYSVDNLIGNNKINNTMPNRYASVTTVALMIQVILIYLVTGLHKVPGIEWQNGTAVYYVMNAELFTSKLGHALTAYPKLMEYLTHFTLYLELYGWLLILIPFYNKYFRLLGVALFIGLHLGFMFFMRLGFFPWVDIASWIPIIPGMVWNLFNFNFIEIWKDKIGAFFQNMVDRLTAWKVIKPYEYNYSLGPIGTILVIIFIPMMIAWNGQALGYFKLPVKAQRLLQYPGLWQSWKMFAPNPIKHDGWFVWEAQLRSGEKIGLFTEEPVTFDKPDIVFNTAINQRWRKLLRNVMTNKNYKDHWIHICRFLAREWNAEHKNTKKELETLSVYFMKEKTLPNYEPPKVKKEVKYNYWTQSRYKDRFEKADKGGGENIRGPVLPGDQKAEETTTGKSGTLSQPKKDAKKNPKIKLDGAKKKGQAEAKKDPNNVDRVKLRQ